MPFSAAEKMLEKDGSPRRSNRDSVRFGSPLTCSKQTAAPPSDRDSLAGSQGDSCLGSAAAWSRGAKRSALQHGRKNYLAGEAASSKMMRSSGALFRRNSS